MCRCCQSCFESFCWNCFEQRFCYDDKIAYYCEEHDEHHFDSKCYQEGKRAISNGFYTNNNTNGDAIFNQPEKSKLNRQSSWLTEAEFQREIQITVPANDIFKAFENSNIFVDETKVKQQKVPKKYNLETVTEENTNTATGVCHIAIFNEKDEALETTSHDMLDSILPPNLDRVLSSSSIKSIDSGALENKHFRHVVGPKQRTVKSHSIVTMHDRLSPVAVRLDRPVSDSNIFTISRNNSITSNESTQTQLSLTPEIPITKINLPKFFLETPELGEYKVTPSLNDLTSPDVIFTELDYSMPRYYGKSLQILPTGTAEVHKSMPNINNLNPSTQDKGDVSKRLTQLRQKLSPLVIKNIK